MKEKDRQEEAERKRELRGLYAHLMGGTAGKTVVSMVVTFVYKILGFVKNALFAALFGASAYTDAVYMAVNVFGLLSGSAASLVGVLIPTRAKAVSEGGQSAGDRIASMLMILSGIISVAMTVFLLLFAPQIVSLFAPSFEGAARDGTILFLRILSPLALFSCVARFLGELQSTAKNFVLNAMGGLIVNLSGIALGLLLYRPFGIYAMLVALMVGMVAPVFLYLRGIRKIFRFTFSINLKDKGLKAALVLWLPIAVGTLTGGINQAVDKALASGLPMGSVTGIGYAVTLLTFISNIVTQPISTAMYVSLSEQAQQRDSGSFKALMMRVVIILMALLLPIVLLCMLYSGEIVTIVYGRGAFDAQAIGITGEALFFYAATMVTAAVAGIFERGFFACSDTRTPFFISLVTIVLDTGLSILLVPTMGVGGLALGSVIGSAAGAVLSFALMRKKIGPMGALKWLVDGGKCLAGLAALLAVALPLRHLLGGQHAMVSFGAGTLAGGAAYFGALLLLRQSDVVEGAGKAIALLRRKG